MNLFNLFKRPDGPVSTLDTTPANGSESHHYTPPAPDIPENIFIEQSAPKTPPVESPETIGGIHNLHTLYQYLENNLESRGYEDALMNPDSSIMEEQVQYIQNELNLLISRVKTYYSGHLRSVDFHIETRKRSGMIETVEELLSHRETILDEIKAVASIEADTAEGRGLSQNLILGYRKGFRNGFAAITYNSILGKRNQS